MLDKREVVVILGSGIGGLVAGSELSKNRKVIVLEKNTECGGYCNTFERDGFVFEPAIQALNGVSKGLLGELYKKTGATNNVHMCMPALLYRSIYPDRDIAIPQRNLSKYKEILFSLFPSEKSGITKLFDTMEQIYGEMDKFHREKVLRKSSIILQYGRVTLEAFLNEFIKDNSLKTIISQYWVYRGLPPCLLSATTFSYIWYDYTVNGSYFPRDGMRCIISNLISEITANGGEVMCDSEVVGLVMNSHNRVKGAKLSDGKVICGDIFISNIDIFKTISMVDISGHKQLHDYAKSLEKNALSISAYKIYLGLNIDVRENGLTDYEIFINPSYDIESMYKSCVNNDFERSPLSITIYSNLSDSFCGRAKSVVSIGMLSGYNYWRDLSQSEYKCKKRDAADIIINRCERVIPNLKKAISVQINATPITMEKYSGNSDGAIYGWCKKSLIDEVRYSNPTTPIKNLFLSSQWTKTGGGVGGVLLSADRLCSILNKN